MRGLLGTASPTEPERPAPIPPAVVRCMFGGQDPFVPDPGRQVRVIAVIDVERSAATLVPVRIELLDARGEAVAAMGELIQLRRLPYSPLRPTWTQLSERRKAEPDDAPDGPVRRVVEAWLDGKPSSPPTRIRVELASDDGAGHTRLASAGYRSQGWVVAEGDVDDEWSTA